MWTRQRKRTRLQQAYPSSSACPSAHLLDRAQWGPPGRGICVPVPWLPQAGMARGCGLYLHLLPSCP